MLTTLSGEEQLQLRGELQLIEDSFSLVEFDDEEVDEKKGAHGISIDGSERTLHRC